MLRLLQVGLGPLGRRIVADLNRRGLGRVVAALDPDPSAVGKDLSELVPGSPVGVRVGSVPGEVADWDEIRCAVVATRSDLELCMDTFRELLQRGCSIVSTCEELAWPWLRHPVLASELHELAVRNRAHVVGTGVNPGFLMDALPVAVTTACNRVDRVRVERVQNASLRRIPFQRKIGAGLDPTAFAARRADGSLRHVGLPESLHFLAHYVGFELDEWDETIEPLLADSSFESDVGPIRPGLARGVRQVARGLAGGQPVAELVFHAALQEHDSYDRIRITGEPELELTFRGGVHGDTATSAIVLNTIRALLAAEPGLHTMATLPLQGCTPRSRWKRGRR